MNPLSVVCHVDIGMVIWKFYLRVEKFIKDKLIDKAYIKGADGERTAVVQLRRELILSELDEIQATREI